MAEAPAAQPFSIRGFAARMRAVDAAECYPFGGGCMEGEGEPRLRFPPMDPAPRSRWWKHELAAGQARLAAGAKGGEAAAAGGPGGGLQRGTKRKGFRAGERARKRRRVLQFRSFLKNKEKIAKSESTFRLHEHKLHMALSRKPMSSTVRRTELEPRKNLEEAWDPMPTHENNGNKRSRERMDPSSERHSNLFGRRETNVSLNKKGIEVSGSTNYPTNTGCEVAKPSTGSKDDIFGDLPLLELESSKIIFQTGVDELPTVIEESFITNQSEADSIPEVVPLKLIDASDITAQTPSPLKDLGRSEDDEPACISRNVVPGSHPSTVGIDDLPNHKNINVVRAGLDEMQLNVDASALSSHSELRSKCGSSKRLQDCFDANKNCYQEINKHCMNSTSPPAIRTRTEATNCTNASVKGKNGTDITSAVVALPVPRNHVSYQASALPSVISHGVFSTRIDANDTSLFRMPAKECTQGTRPSGNFRSNVCPESRKHMDPCTSLSTDNQGSWHSKVHPICSPADIGMAFIKLPGLERMEISNCSVKIGEDRFINTQSMNTVRYQKQQLVSGTTNMMQGQKTIVPSDSQTVKTVLDDYMGQGDRHLQQPTVRLMGKTVSVCKHSKGNNGSTMGKVSTDNVTVEANLSQLPQRRSFPCQDPVISRVHLNGSPDFLARIPNSNVSGQNATFSGLQNQRSRLLDSSSSIKDLTWNFGGQFVHQAELKKASMISTNSQTRHLELRQQPHLISIPQNQQSHLWTSASPVSTKDRSLVGPVVNQSSPVPPSLIKASMKEKYQKSTLLSCDDPSSVPICQPYHIPGAKSSSASAISFLDYSANNSLSRSSSPGLSLSLATGLASESVLTGRPTCAGSLMDTSGKKDASFADPVSKRPAYADNVSQQPAKRQLLTDRHDYMSMGQNIVNPSPGWSQQPAKKQLVTDRDDFITLGPNSANHSPGWSLSDAVGPQVLDFSKRVARDAVHFSRNESNNSRASSGLVPPIEMRSRAGLVAGSNAMLKPGQNLNDHSKLNSVVL